MIGQQFLTFDKMIGKLEKDITKKKIIADFLEYVQILSQEGTTMSLVGKVKNFKDSTATVVCVLGE